MIWLGLAVYQTDINCRAYKNCRQSQIFFKKNVAKLLTTKVCCILAKMVLDLSLIMYDNNRQAKKNRLSRKTAAESLSRFAGGVLRLYKGGAKRSNVQKRI